MDIRIDYFFGFEVYYLPTGIDVRERGDYTLLGMQKNTHHFKTEQEAYNWMRAERESK